MANLYENIAQTSEHEIEELMRIILADEVADVVDVADVVGFKMSSDGEFYGFHNNDVGSSDVGMLELGNSDEPAESTDCDDDAAMAETTDDNEEQDAVTLVFDKKHKSPQYNEEQDVVQQFYIEKHKTLKPMNYENMRQECIARRIREERNKRNKECFFELLSERISLFIANTLQLIPLEIIQDELVAYGQPTNGSKDDLSQQLREFITNGGGTWSPLPVQKRKQKQFNSNDELDVTMDSNEKDGAKILYAKAKSTDIYDILQN